MLNKYLTENLKETSSNTNIKSYLKTITFSLFFIVFLFGVAYIIKYPDIIEGKVIILGDNKANTIYSHSSGEVYLFVNEYDSVQKDDLIAHIKNPVSYSDLTLLKHDISKLDINNLESLALFPFRDDLSLGDIEVFYQNFKLALLEFENDNLIDIKKQKIINLTKTKTLNRKNEG